MPVEHAPHNAMDDPDEIERPRQATSGRWEMWMDAAQAAAVRAATDAHTV